MKHRGSADLSRRRGKRPERRRILIVTEGVETEPQYFEGLARFARATGLSVYPADVVGIGRDPVRVVNSAVRRRDDDQRAKPPRERYDDVWCVFDVDRHEVLGEAITQARRESVKVAISNPCFELWLLWHFTDLFAATSAVELRHRLRQHGCAGKSLPRSFAYGNYSDAERRARRRRPHDPYAVPSNPGTTVCAVTEVVIGRTGNS